MNMSNCPINNNRCNRNNIIPKEDINQQIKETLSKCRAMTVQEYIQKYGENSIPESFKKKQNIRIYEKNELAAAIIYGLLSVGTAIGENVFESFIDSVCTLINPWIVLPIRKFAIDLYKDKIFEATKAAMFDQTFITTKPDTAGVNPDEQDFEKMIVDLAYCTIVLTSMVSEDAGEVAFQNLQNALSNCTMAGIGGALTHMGNYRVGLQPISDLEESDEYMQVHVDTRSVIDAFAGYPIHYTVTKEALRRIKQASEAYDSFHVLRSIIDSQMALNWPYLYLGMHAGHLIMNTYEAVLHDIKSAMYTLWRRVTDIIQAVRVAWAEYNAKILSKDEISLVLLDAQIELQNIEKELEELINLYDEALQQFNTLALYVQKYQNLVTTLVKIYRDYVNDTILDDFDKYVNNIQSIRSGYVKLVNVNYVLII